MWISKEKYERLLSQVKIQDARITCLAGRVYTLEQQKDTNTVMLLHMVAQADELDKALNTFIKLRKRSR